MIYNPKTFQMEPNPDVKYAYGSKCVEECPGMSVLSNYCHVICQDAVLCRAMHLAVVWLNKQSFYNDFIFALYKCDFVEILYNPVQ